MTQDNKKVPGVEPPSDTAREPGLRSVKTTNAFRIVNFELFAKPNKKVMSVGGVAFLLACSYLAYLRITDEYKGIPTYTTLSDDGTLTRRVKKSKWD